VHGVHPLTRSDARCSRRVRTQLTTLPALHDVRSLKLHPHQTARPWDACHSHAPLTVRARSAVFLECNIVFVHVLMRTHWYDTTHVDVATPAHEYRIYV